jgi:ornithine decarboxylase
MQTFASPLFHGINPAMEMGKLNQPITAPITPPNEFAPVIETRPMQEILEAEAANPQTFIEDPEDAFYVCDLGETYRQLTKWERNLPNIHPFFAIKSNPNPEIISLLAKCGTGFDCASKTEIATILSNGVEANRIIFANPCKPPSHIRYASTVGVRMMTFDNADELYKIHQNHNNPQLVLRILTDDSKSVCQFGVKFGASIQVAHNLLDLAHELGLEVIGVSFHVGSGCRDPMAYDDALMRARNVFDYAENLGYNMSLLDIGGGFPGGEAYTGVKFEEVAQVINQSVKRLFSPSVQVIAEPGRYLVSSVFTLAVSVCSRRVVPKENSTPNYMYYINDGVYGSFNCLIFDHAELSPKVLMKDGVLHSQLPQQLPEFECSIWGPTCDSMDVIAKGITLPELKVGDWIFYENMGAYTTCAASEFNGFRKSRIIYTNTELEAIRARLGFQY